MAEWRASCIAAQGGRYKASGSLREHRRTRSAAAIRAAVGKAGLLQQPVPRRTWKKTPSAKNNPKQCLLLPAETSPQKMAASGATTAAFPTQRLVQLLLFLLLLRLAVVLPRGLDLHLHQQLKFGSHLVNFNASTCPFPKTRATLCSSPSNSRTRTTCVACSTSSLQAFKGP